MDWSHLISSILILVVSSIPLYLAVNLLGGRASLLKVILVNLAIGFLDGLITSKFGFLATIISFVILLALYKIMFDLGWIRAFFAWILQAALAILLTVLVHRYIL